jgi:S1-C subfamily serine protease
MGRRVLFSVVCWLVFQAPMFAQSWVAIAAKVRESIVNVESETTKCTGFVIDAARGHVLSASHCVGEELYADHKPATIVALFPRPNHDLVVLKVSDIEDRPALKLADGNPEIGEDVASYGWGYALDRPLFRQASISDDDMHIPEDGVGGPFMVIDASFIGGQSGGPVVNSHGDVVMIVQRGTPAAGFGVGAKILKQRVGKYFTK